MNFPFDSQALLSERNNPHYQQIIYLYADIIAEFKQNLPKMQNIYGEK
jgi:hypothetical protein